MDGAINSMKSMHSVLLQTCGLTFKPDQRLRPVIASNWKQQSHLARSTKYLSSQQSIGLFALEMIRTRPRATRPRRGRETFYGTVMHWNSTRVTKTFIGVSTKALVRGMANRDSAILTDQRFRMSHHYSRKTKHSQRFALTGTTTSITSSFVKSSVG